MLIGQRFGDDRLLALAAAYERRHGWLPDRSR
jgi:Asp-tRNA(Asn)/Glu-tRNA(Gln) amidotransferase A subunit family amidase